MKKIMKPLISGATVVLLGMFFYSGFLFYQDNPHRNPFPNEKYQSVIVDKEVVTDQNNTDRNTVSTGENQYSFRFKPIKSYAFYRNLALKNPAFIEMNKSVTSAVHVFNGDLKKFNKDASIRYKELEDSVKEFKENN